MKKTVQVIMLPNYNNGLNEANGCFWFNNRNNHLYFTSNEEIKEGDWFYCSMLNEKGIQKCNRFSSQKAIIFDKGENGFYTKDCVKVIATTDESLGLPLIPSSFVQDYVKSNGDFREIDIRHNEYTLSRKDGKETEYITFWTHGDEKRAKQKAQTVEEAADEAVRKMPSYDILKPYEIENYKTLFIAGAKWGNMRNLF